MCDAAGMSIRMRVESLPAFREPPEGYSLSEVEVRLARPDQRPLRDTLMDGRRCPGFRRLSGAAVIPAGKNRTELRERDREMCKRRRQMEHFFAGTKEFQAVAARYGKTDESFGGRDSSRRRGNRGDTNVHRPFDPTCGSGTTACVAEQWGRRWIACDTSRVALTLAKQRLMTANYDYYKLVRPEEGIGSGFRYRSVATVTARTLGYNEPPKETMLFDQPRIDRNKARVTGPFTVETVPAPTVIPINLIEKAEPCRRTTPCRAQARRRDRPTGVMNCSRTGIRGKAVQRISFARLEPLPGTRWLHAEGETRSEENCAGSCRDSASGFARFAVSFGPDHAPLEQRQMELAIEESQSLVPKPKIVVFAAFQFDPEAAKDIDQLRWPGVTLPKAQMNADSLTDDLKKARASNESFWLIGQPDVAVEHIANGIEDGSFRVSVHGFDYYNTRTGNVESGGAERIALWMLDPDYHGRSLFP